MTRVAMGLWFVAVALLATACGQVPGTDRPESTPTIQKAAQDRQGVSAQADDEEPPVLPQIVNPSEELRDFDPQGTLRWTEVPGADAYEVWVYYTDSEGWEHLAEFSGPLTSRQYQFTKLSADTPYYYGWLYVRVGGEWQEDALFFFLEPTARVVKARLSNTQEEIEAFATGGTLRWAPVEGAESYEVWIYQDRALQALAETSGPLRVTQYAVHALAAGKTYYAQVHSRVDGVFHAGGPLAITVVAESSRARLVNPQQELDAFAPGGLLRWTTVSGATAYEVWIFTNPNASEFHESSGRLTARAYAPGTLLPGDSYYIQVYSLVDSEWQVGAPVKISTVAEPTIARLVNPQEEIEGFATDGTLRWNAVPGADRYEVWIYGSAGLGTVSETGFPEGTSYAVKQLCNGGTYYLELYARVNGQWSAGWPTRLDVTQGTSPANCVPPTPMVALTASPVDVHAGESFTLTWTSRFASRCTAAGDWSGDRPTSGSEPRGPLTTAQRFSLLCEGPSGTTYVQTLVVVALPKYTAVRLPLARAWAINDSGEVSGNSIVQYGPGVWGIVAGAYIDGQLVALPGAVGLDINAQRQVTTGAATLPTENCCSGGVFNYNDGSFTALPGLSTLAINDDGHVAGAEGPPARAVLWIDGVTTSLPMPIGTVSIANDVNERGEVVGDWRDPTEPACRGRTQAFHYAAGTLTELGTLGGDSSHAEAVNATGTIVGNSRLPDGREHAFRRDAFGLNDLGTLGGLHSAAFGVNDAGQVVGSSETAWSGGDAYPAYYKYGRAFLFAYGMMYDLNDYLSDDSNTGGLAVAVDINNTGQIVANSCWDWRISSPLCEPLALCESYLLTPVAGTP